jgi:hypothetical protein
MMITKSSLFQCPEQYRRSLDGLLCDAVEVYVNQRILPGGFLRACLRNDFALAVLQADHRNLRSIRTIAELIYNELPGACWGSTQAVSEWTTGREACVGTD